MWEYCAHHICLAQAYEDVLEIIEYVHYVGHHLFSRMHMGKRGGAEDVKHTRSFHARHIILTKVVRFHFRRKSQKRTMFYGMSTVLVR